MSGEINFAAIPFEAYDGSRTLTSEQSALELEKEFGRRARSRGSSAHTPRVILKQSQKRPSISQLGPEKPVRPSHFFHPRRPRGVVFEPYGAAAEPYPAEPGSEYIRWVQSALNDVLGLRLPLHGVANAATRSAIRSFQQREGLPVDGVTGPDTERALIAARGAKSSPDGAPRPTGPEMPAPTEPVSLPPEPPPNSPPAELGLEWEILEREPSETRERAAVRNRIAAGQRDPNALTDMVFFGRHSERRGRRLGASEHKLVAEWKAILRNVVLPEFDARGRQAAGMKRSDPELAATLAMAATTVPGLGITLEKLLVLHQAEAKGIPIEVLLAFIHFEAGRLFDDATAGKWNEKYKRYIPSFYELGVFQTPAGDHGCTKEAGAKKCKYRPPGRNIENSQFGKGWRSLTGAYPTESNWKDPTMQVRVGLWDLGSTADRIRINFGALFPSNQSEWYLRMAVLYSFAAGAGAARSFLRKYKTELSALPEGKRWDFLRGKNVGTFYFNPENVDKKMALAAKLRAVRGVTVP